MLENVRAELIKSEISHTCSKSFIEQSDFLLEKSNSIFVSKELSFENWRTWKQYASRIIVTFPGKFDIFSSKSQEKPRISAKDVCITFAQYCTSFLSDANYVNQIRATIRKVTDEYVNDDSVNPTLMSETIKLKIREQSIK